MICQVCHHERPSLVSGVVNGVYITERCDLCFNPHRQPRAADSASYNLDRQREDFAGDILQPYGVNGQPNPEFAHRYPKKAKAYYNSKQLEDL